MSRRTRDALEAARERYDAAGREVRRLEQRRAEIAERAVRDEARKLRFLRRIDGDIAMARDALIVAEGELEMARAEVLAQAHAERGGE